MTYWVLSYSHQILSFYEGFLLIINEYTSSLYFAISVWVLTGSGSDLREKTGSDFNLISYIHFFLFFFRHSNHFNLYSNTVLSLWSDRIRVQPNFGNENGSGSNNMVITVSGSDLFSKTGSGSDLFSKTGSATLWYTMVSNKDIHYSIWAVCQMGTAVR